MQRVYLRVGESVRIDAQDHMLCVSRSADSFQFTACLRVKSLLDALAQAAAGREVIDRFYCVVGDRLPAELEGLYEFPP